MAERAERQADYWRDKFGATEKGRLRFERTAGALPARWRSDELMDVGAWELPEWARGSIPAGVRVVVDPDGAILLPERSDVLGDVVNLASRRPPAPKK